jgi:hypothetical protein
MSAIMRRRSGLTMVVLLMENSILNEVVDTSILRRGLSIPLSFHLSLDWQSASRLMLPPAVWSAATSCAGPSQTPGPAGTRWVRLLGVLLPQLRSDVEASGGAVVDPGCVKTLRLA